MDTVQELVIRSLQGGLTPSEWVRLMAWRWAAPENELYFRDVQRIWSLTGRPPHTALRPPPGAPLSEDP